MKRWLHPQPHILDLRSLKALRILIGLYICYDVATRLYPASSIYWYTSIPADWSFLDPEDTPHRSIVHRVWFYRGSAAFQYLNFGLIFGLGTLFGIGKLSSYWYLEVTLLLLYVAMQNRNMSVHDGSDNFVRQILLWFILIPTPIQIRIDKASFRSRQEHPVSCLAFLGMVLQVALMYLGTVAKRSIDNVGDPHFEYNWLPPKLDAVYYIVRDAFAIREHSMIIRAAQSSPLWLVRIMTFVAMVGESSVLVWILLPADSPWRFGAFITYFKIHLGMMLMMRLPNWQLLAMSVSTIWIPSCYWDKIATIPPISSYKKDDDTQQDDVDPKSGNKTTWVKGSAPRRILTCFFFVYMFYNWCGERQWIRKHDGGDIGEFFRISQHWVMYNSPPKRRCAPQLLQINHYKGNGTEVVLDAMRGMRTGRWEILDDSKGAETFVSPRWERAMGKMSQPGQKARPKYLLKALCAVTGGSQPSNGQELLRRDLRLQWDCRAIPPPQEYEISSYDDFAETIVFEEACAVP